MGLEASYVYQPPEGEVVHAPWLSALLFCPGGKYSNAPYNQCQTDICLAGARKYVWTLQRHNFRDVSFDLNEHRIQRKKNRQTKANYYNNKLNMLCAFTWPCFSHNAVFILLSCWKTIFEIYLKNHLRPSVTLFELKWVATVSYHKTWNTWHKQTTYQTHTTHISVWHLKDKKGLTIPPCSVVHLSH